MSDELFIQSELALHEAWPEQDMESVRICPMCESEQRTLEYSGVKDWVFGCAAGSWIYSRCDSCRSLYLDPRPTEATIGKAYANYYTHSPDVRADKASLRNSAFRVAVAIKQGFLNFHFGTNLKNSIALPTFIYRILGKFELLPRIFLQDIEWSNPGKMLDLGCGDGRSMLVAERFGWTVTGIEIDSAAVKSAIKNGLDVRLGSYRDIVGLKRKFDLIVCSHVIEHVHNPRELLSLALASLEDGGQLWLQWPNPKSDGLKKYGIHWRGLEAPRHLCLPSIDSIISFAESNESASFVVKDNSKYWKWAQMTGYEASENIKNGGFLRSGAGQFNVLRAAIRFLLTKRNIAECEVCTVTIKKHIKPIVGEPNSQ